jgi:hypothetical protein
MKLFCTSEKLMNTVEVALSDIVLDRRGPRRGTGEKVCRDYLFLASIHFQEFYSLFVCFSLVSTYLLWIKLKRAQNSE